MQSDAPESTNHDTLKGLPPVTPPSGKFIAQLFVIPAVIVAVAVGGIWFVTWLVGGFFSPDQFLKDLRSNNADVRWRRASDLSQVLKRDDTLAANPVFALDLAEMLRQALRENEQAETEFARRPKELARQEDPTNPAKHPLQDDRAFIEFLIACMGNFSTPVGVPVLSEVAVKEDGADATTVALRRQLAVWALANLGENFKRFDQLPVERRVATIAALEAEAQDSSTPRRDWARASLDFLKARAEGKPQALGVDVALAKCATAEDASLRKFVALALAFWEGTPAENERMEDTLLKLTRDDGHGGDDTSLRGREIRYQATRALARRGSAKIADRLGVLGEMLDEEQQARNFQTRLKDGRVVADGTMVRSVLTGALKSIAELHARNPSIDLSALVPAIDKLAGSDNPVLKTEAERTLIILKSQ